MAQRLCQALRSIRRALLAAWRFLATHHPWYRESIDAETAAALRQLETCMHCGGWHGKRACPRVRRIVFSASGNPAEVEYFPWRDWPREHVIFEDQLP